MDRRHWLLLLAAAACIAGLVLWIGEIDLGMEESIAPAPVPASPHSAMTALLLTLTLALFHLVGPVPADLGVHNGALSPCESPAHCARAELGGG